MRFNFSIIAFVAVAIFAATLTSDLKLEAAPHNTPVKATALSGRSEEHTSELQSH